MAADLETPAAEAATAVSAGRRVVDLDEENPWPSLDSFTENAALFFKGRSAENQELQRRITRHMLTVLFGISGLGKTSLLQAGVFPILREEGFMPVRIQLDHNSSLRHNLVEQVREELRKELERGRYYARRGPETKESLWAYFHQPELEIRDREMGDRVVNPVLVFDQFEEIFSHGQSDPSHEWAQRALIEELAQLIDNCVPPDLKRELESDPATVRRYDFDNQDYRIVLSLREDYLPHLESLSWQIPSVTENRFRLLAMNKESAFEAVKEPGRKIVKPIVARQIVEFAAGESQSAALPGAPAARRADADGVEGEPPAVQRSSSVSPALLSLICSELNEERKRLNAARITAEQVTNNAGQILDRFYDRCFKALPFPDKVREVVEGNLVSADNYRERISLSTILTGLQRQTGCTHEEAQQILERLRDWRLVQFDSREGRTTIELTHDVLCGPAVKSRQARLAAAEAAQRRTQQIWQALCFVIMPFGQKPDLKSGVVVDFDQIYNEAIKPAIEECGLEAIRGDEERTGGIIPEALFARLLLAEFVVADLTLADANVFYQLGIRHTAKPFTTVPIFANVRALPFDVALVRALGYQLEKGKLTKAAAHELRTELKKRLLATIDGAATNDSPLFQLIPEFPGIDVPDEVTYRFKDHIRRAEEFGEILFAARSLPTLAERREALLKIQRDLGDLKTVLQSVLIELMTSYRDAEAFEELIALYNAFPDSLKDYFVAKQLFALALNRRNRPGDRGKALMILDDLLKNRGPDSETLGIKGRIHKDIYKEAWQAGRITAAAAIDDAIDAYTKSFEADPRDYYPGVNAINLLMQKGDNEALKEVARLLPLVSFAVERRGGASSSDYWDVSTVLELACIGEDWATATRVLPKAILAAMNSFETATTVGNLRLLKQAWERAGREVTELDGILNELSARDIELRGEEKTQSA